MEKQTFLSHLTELRTRIFWVVLILFIGAGIGYAFYDVILQILVQPLNQTLYYTKPGGGLDLMLKICFLIGALLAVPMALFQAFSFMSPLLKVSTKLFVTYLTLASVLLLAIGVTFSYFVALPASLRFLMEFSTDKIQALITTDSYLSFVLVNLAIAALMFQLPIILIFIDRIKPLKPKKLLFNQHWVILGSFILAAIVTPTVDPINQCLIAVPIIILYDVAVATLWIFGTHKKQTSAVLSQPEPAFKPISSPVQSIAPQTQPIRPVIKSRPAARSIRTLDGFTAKPSKNFVKPHVKTTPQSITPPVLLVNRRRLIQL